MKDLLELIKEFNNRNNIKNRGSDDENTELNFKIFKDYQEYELFKLTDKSGINGISEKYYNFRITVEFPQAPNINDKEGWYNYVDNTYGSFTLEQLIELLLSNPYMIQLAELCGYNLTEEYLNSLNRDQIYYIIIDIAIAMMKIEINQNIFNDFRNCFNCFDCINCDNCNNCIACFVCSACNNCKYSGELNNCNNCSGKVINYCKDEIGTELKSGGCENCVNCVNCLDCINCIDCNNCKDCEECKACTSCEYSNNCGKCKNCVSCDGSEDCRNCRHLDTCFNCDEVMPDDEEDFDQADFTNLEHKYKKWDKDGSEEYLKSYFYFIN